MRLTFVLIFLIPLAFAVCFFVAGKKLLEKTLESFAANMQYNDSIYDAANYAELLLYAREGNGTSLIHRLENLTDASLLMASVSTNATLRVLHDFPWAKLRADRESYPRQTTTNREARISKFLDELIKEQPQQPH